MKPGFLSAVSSSLFRGMRLSHSYAVHSCFGCGRFSHHSSGSPNWSLPYLLLSIGAAIPIWLFIVLPPLNLHWTSGFGFVAGELLLFYFASFLAGILHLWPNRVPRECPSCRVRLVQNGAYFKNGGRFNGGDVCLVVIFIASNVAFWIFVLMPLRGG